MKRNPTTMETIKAFKEFMTDGCSFVPDMVFCECCVEHDVDYSTGTVTREEADKKLRECIKAEGYPILCWAYWLGVRIFGWVPYYFGISAEYREEYRLFMKAKEDDTP
jgi:hypothetical protein